MNKEKIISLIRTHEDSNIKVAIELAKTQEPKMYEEFKLIAKTLLKNFYEEENVDELLVPSLKQIYPKS